MIQFIEAIFENLNTWGLAVLTLIVGIAEFSLGLYGKEWNRNEKILDLACYALPRLVTRPLVAYFGLKLVPFVLPHAKDAFEWVPFFWGFVIICIYDDLTQYWYHRLHHEIPWLWRFHRTHHSASYMGMAMASRQNIIYTIFFSQTYLTVILVYLGLGYPALFAKGIKSLITKMAHSSIKWDKPFYEKKWLHPLAWILERTISTPATHHAHHADTTDDGIGYYKGNFGNMFFLWDVIFGTALITRQYPKSYGISHYEGDEWYAQLLWPLLKSSVPGSELAAHGPMVREDIQPNEVEVNNTKEEVTAPLETDGIQPRFTA
ncbi:MULTISPECIES: sterol desaturase family protein [Olivibacter]|jgi:sterol desaturase/sphingolipid hydroxylase (fatty acid hydroxylase superfamily)|uniref:Sterol desaturase family protein n=1 Tax=Olivibacter oleidegradans TaxID=760123 RepID=A0ABV6HTC7_9SPHI|nr:MULTISPECIES: sterol desaturase family protein [Olivibacter]MCL4637879.1 sterol desaturase family protein [Olivibacter sp. UJ_SKK_5.1]MDM8174222.1 sterol desaturase family protein [Olivibacter sp. 47]MDX3917330.1 sterol desaturase family protein [Pseudosphingobacterium sp.]QEL04052.1 sterol desaturase family protein [Olivibacter sp. LS-1]